MAFVDGAVGERHADEVADELSDLSRERVAKRIERRER